MSFLKRMKTEIFMGKLFLHQVIDILTFSLQFNNKIWGEVGKLFCNFNTLVPHVGFLTS